MAYKQQQFTSQSSGVWKVQDPGAGRLAVMAGEDPPSGSEAAPSWSVLTWWEGQGSSLGHLL